MSRFYVPKENVRGDNIIIDGAEAKHITTVMRLAMGDTVVIFDGTGKEYIGVIKNITSKGVNVAITETRAAGGEDLVRVTLAQAIPKKEKMDYIVEKSTELGVHEILPIVTERTVVRVDEDDRKKKHERWQRLAQEAAKQCGRRDIPQIRPIMLLGDSIKMVNDFDLSLVAYLSDDTVPLRDAIKNTSPARVAVYVGPEGDFSPKEIDLFKSNTKARYVSLGKRVLKSDTAGLFLLSCINYEFSR